MTSRDIFDGPLGDKRIQDSVCFLVDSIRASGKNPKPVIIHSIRVGIHLQRLGYDDDVVIAAMLHDVVEDSDVRLGEIKERFGNRVAELVGASTFDKSIPDATERYEEAFARGREAGKDALAIRAADFFDNLNYYHLADEELRAWLLLKLDYFMASCEGEMKGEPVYGELARKSESMRKDLLKAP